MTDYPCVLTLYAETFSDESVGIFGTTYGVQNLKIESELHREEVRAAFKAAFFLVDEIENVMFNDEYDIDEEEWIDTNEWEE